MWEYSLAWYNGRNNGQEEEEEVPSLFNPPRRLPTEQEQKVLLAQVVAILAVLKNHTYQFSQHENKFLPILDLEVQVQQVAQENQPSLAKLYYFYSRKPMAHWQFMPATSAMPSAVKRTYLTQYGLRILRNTKP